MADFDLGGITLEQLQMFSVAADTLNFTKTAEQLGMMQSTVSKRISMLEAALGVKLFVRWRRSLQLTAAGEIFLDCCKIVLDTFMAKANMAIQASTANDQALLTIAYSNANYPYHIGMLFSAVHPEIKVRYIRRDYTGLLRCMNDGEADFAFYGEAGKEAFYEPPLRCEQIATMPLWVFMSQDNPLSKLESVSVEMLTMQKFILPSPINSPWCNFVTELCKASGFLPQVAEYTSDILSMGMNLTQNDTIFISDIYAHHSYHELKLSTVRLKEPSNSSNLIWNRNSKAAQLAPDLISSAKLFWAREPYATVV